MLRELRISMIGARIQFHVSVTEWMERDRPMGEPEVAAEVNETNEVHKEHIKEHATNESMDQGDNQNP